MRGAKFKHEPRALDALACEYVPAIVNDAYPFADPFVCRCLGSDAMPLHLATPVLLSLSHKVVGC